jgi:hypothetical protein
MSAIELLEPFLEQGIRNTNFFNGRLLSAEDLRTEQEANRQQHQQLGQSIGAGIAYGLEVRQAVATSLPSGTAAPQVTVSAGLALNGRGQALFLPSAIELALVREQETVAAGAGLFAACEPLQATAILTGTGVYLLALAPASGFAGRAPVSGLGGNGVTGGSCGSRFAVEGVQFRLVNVPVSSMPDISPTLREQLDQLMASGNAASLSKLRNLLAHVCFGTEALQDFFRDPFKRVNTTPLYATYGALDTLRAAGSLSDCDVPLALLYWTTQGIQFVDMWSVRRSLTRPATATHWSPFIDDRHVGQGEAMFLQFQDQVDTLRAPGAVPESVVATQYFNYLPAAGILPLAGMRAARGFDYLQFFSGLTSSKPVFIEGTKVGPLIRTSLAYLPIELRSQELIRLYMVRENMQAIDTSTSSPPQYYLLFASGHIPYQGDAHYDLARWNYSNYA